LVLKKRAKRLGVIAGKCGQKRKNGILPSMYTTKGEGKFAGGLKLKENQGAKKKEVSSNALKET